MTSPKNHFKEVSLSLYIYNIDVRTHPKFNSSPLKNGGNGRRSFPFEALQIYIHIQWISPFLRMSSKPVGHGFKSLRIWRIAVWHHVCVSWMEKMGTASAEDSRPKCCDHPSGHGLRKELRMKWGCKWRFLKSLVGRENTAADGIWHDIAAKGLHIFLNEDCLVLSPNQKFSEFYNFGSVHTC